ncbi:MAG TPA: family 78 glycoside hydrolase catalytic domain, partial [Acidobacteriaceae bacterium]|nr:family 78 glycoside hydrolase catalytic domain [Acidobacteriaceae bacterium]
MKTQCFVAMLAVSCAVWGQADGRSPRAKHAPVKKTQEEPSPAWTAKWIQAPWSTERDGAELDGSRPMPVFRREFVVRTKPVNATLRIAGLGQFEARLGSRDEVRLVGAHGLHQAWTNYAKTVTFESYDVTRWLTPGSHVLGVMLGNGMYNVQKTRGRYTKFEGSFGVPKLIAELRVRYADGKTDTIGTDAAWKVIRGPVVFSSTYGGEDFDGRRVQDGWDRTGFAATDWSPARETTGPGGELIPAITQEVREGDFHEPVKTVNLGGGKVVYDLGVNFAGVPFVRVEGPTGATLKLIPGELLKPDGTVTQTSSGGPVWWSYTLRGDGTRESWSPQFGYYGFRYIQAEWVGAKAGKLDSISGMEWHSSAPVAGTFESSSEMLNAIHRLIVSAMHNNEVSIFTDCPHREKLGWLEQTHLVAS